MADQEDKDTNLNPGEADYNQKVNNIAKTESDGTFDDSVDKSVPDAEENPTGPWTNNTGQNKGPVGANPSTGNGFNKIEFLKKKGPAAGIIITIAAGIIGITGLASAPALLIVQFKEVLFGAANVAGPALSLRTNLMLARKVSSVSNAFSQSADGTCNIKCRFGTIDETMKLNFESKSNDFTVKFGDKKFGGRYVIESIKFPDGHTVTNGADFKAALADPARASAFNKIFNSKTAYLLNSKFGNLLKAKLGLDKLPKLTGDSKEKAIASMRKALGLQGDTAATDPTLKLSPEERASSGPLKPVVETINTAGSKAVLSGKMADVVGGACVLYDMGTTVVFAVAAQKITAFATFAMVFLTLADQIKSGDNPDPAVVEQVGSQLTNYETNKTNADGTPNAYYGKSATDSVGYQMGAYQDAPSTLSKEDQAYSTRPTYALASILSNATGFLVGAGVLGILAARGICLAGNIPLLTAARDCGEEIAAAVVSVETGIGPIVSAGACAAKLAGTVIAMSVALGLLVKGAISGIASGGEIPTLDETTVGPPVGNAAYSGIEGIVGAESTSYGMKAGTTADIKQYSIDTAAINNQNDAIARYDAQKTPFDIQNQYSFLGMFLRNTGLIASKGNSLVSYVNSFASIIPRSFASLIDPASAASTVTAAERKAYLYDNKCQDRTLISIGINADAFCNPSFVMSNSELNADSNVVIQSMIDSTDINSNTGDAIPGSNYQKYLDNCANRKDPLGATASSITDEDYDWKVGLRCTETSPMLSNFRVYTMDKMINDTMDE